MKHNGNVAKWIAKAEIDWRTAEHLSRVRRNPVYDSICFHAQQCAEKYLKAYLVAKKKYFPKTHDLEKLLDLCIKVNKKVGVLRSWLHLLNLYSVDIRYPEASATKEEAKQCLFNAKAVRQELRRLF